MQEEQFLYGTKTEFKPLLEAKGQGCQWPWVEPGGRDVAKGPHGKHPTASLPTLTAARVLGLPCRLPGHTHLSRETSVSCELATGHERPPFDAMLGALFIPKPFLQRFG